MEDCLVVGADENSGFEIGRERERPLSARGLVLRCRLEQTILRVFSALHASQESPQLAFVQGGFVAVRCAYQKFRGAFAIVLLASYPCNQS